MLHRCDEETWRTCCDKRFSFTCEEPERELVCDLFYAGKDGEQCNVGALHPAHDYESFKDLSSSLVDCKLHLLEPCYGRVAESQKSFSWSLRVSRDEASIMSEGIDCAPEGIRALVRLLQAYGFPIRREVVDVLNMQRGVCCDAPLRAVTDSR